MAFWCVKPSSHLTPQGYLPDALQKRRSPVRHCADTVDASVKPGLPRTDIKTAERDYAARTRRPASPGLESLLVVREQIVLKYATCRLVRWLPVCVMLAAAGCAQQAGGPVSRQDHARNTPVSKEELRDALDDFEDIAQATIKEAAGRIDDASKDPAIRRRTLLWRIRMVSACHTVLKQDDPVKALLDAWTVCLRMANYFEQGDGRQLFGEHWDIAAKASHELVAEAERVAGLILSEGKLEATRKQIAALAAEHPMRGEFAGAVFRSSTQAPQAGGPILDVLTLPLAPFRAFGGIDRGAAALVGLSDVADRFTDVVEGLPEGTRWQLELLMLGLDDNETMKSARSSWETLSENSSRAVTAIETWPYDFGEQARLLLEQFDAQQANTQNTLILAQQTVEALDQALARFDGSAQTLDFTARSVDQAGRAWTTTANTIGQVVQDMAALGKDPTTQPATAPTTTSAPAEQQGRPFDILDYRDTADALTRAATELNHLALQVQDLTGSKELEQTLDGIDARIVAAITHTQGEARLLTDRVAWRLAQVIVLTFVCALVYRLVVTRWGTSVPRSAD